MKKIIYSAPSGSLVIVHPAAGARMVSAVQLNGDSVVFPAPIEFDRALVEFGASLIPVFSESEDEFLARTMPRSVPADAVGVRVIDPAELPASRRFRAAWKDTGSGIEIDLEAARAIVLLEADTKSGQVRAAYTAGISIDEKVSWPIKRAEALAYQASGSAAGAPNLALEAQARGIALADLVTKVLDKAAALSTREAAIAGRCGALQDAARVATTVAELAAIDIDSGWPA